MLSKSNIYTFVMYLLISIIILNMNGITYLFFGTNSGFSYLIITFSLYIIFNSKNTKYSFLQKIYTIHFFNYILIGVFAAIINLNVDEKMSKTLEDVVKSLILFHALYSGYQNQIRKRGNAIIVFTAFLFILSVLISFSLEELNIITNKERYRVMNRMSGLFANPNEFAAQALFAMISIYYLFQINYLKNFTFKLLGLTCAFISFYSMIMAFSRSTFVSLSLIIFLIITFNIRNIKNYFYLLPISFALIWIFNFSINSIDDISLSKRLDSTFTIFDSGITDENSAGRLTLFSHSLELISDNPILGLGIGQMQDMKNMGGVHNAYLAILGNSGIFVLLFFSFFLFKLITNLRKQSFKINTQFFLFLIISICVNGMTKTGVFEFKINNLIFAMCIAALSVKDKNKLILKK